MKKWILRFLRCILVLVITAIVIVIHTMPEVEQGSFWSTFVEQVIMVILDIWTFIILFVAMDCFVMSLFEEK